MMRRGTALVWRQVMWPTPFPASDALELISRLAADAGRDVVVFEALSLRGKVSHFYATTPHHIRQLTHSVENITGALTADDSERQHIGTTARLSKAGRTLPLLDKRATETNRQLLSALSSASFKKERAVIRIVLGPGVAPRLAAAKPSDPSQSLASLLLQGARPAGGEVANRMRAKAGEASVSVTVTVGARAASEGRRRTIMGSLLAAMRTAQSAGTRLDFVRAKDRLLDAPARGRVTLTVSEVLTLSGWPLEHENLPGMPPAHPRVLPFIHKDIETSRVFARTVGLGKPRPLGISRHDSLVHTHVLGPTNSGKSSMFLDLACADMDAGGSLVMLDPKNDLITDALARVPEHRRKDVVVIDPTNENPVGINPFASPDTPPELIADGILSIIRDLFPSAFGPRTSDAVYASLLTLANYRGAALTWLPRLFNDDAFRRRILQASNDPAGIDSFWSYYEGLSERARSQMVGPVMSRLRQFLLRPGLRNVLDQPRPKFNLSDLFTKPRIVLIPLNSGILGEAASLLGSLVVSQLQALTLARANSPAAERTPVSIYVDEAQAYVRTSGESVGQALEISRGMGVAWHLAHQHRAQMPREIMAAIDANCLNKVAFRLQADDARATAAMAPKLIAQDFEELPRFGIYASLVRNGENLGWVQGTTIEPRKPTTDPAELKKQSAGRWGRDPNQPAEPISSTNDSPTIGRRKRATS